MISPFNKGGQRGILPVYIPASFIKKKSIKMKYLFIKALVENL